MTRAVPFFPFFKDNFILAELFYSTIAECHANCSHHKQIIHSYIISFCCWLLKWHLQLAKLTTNVAPQEPLGLLEIFRRFLKALLFSF